MLIKALSLQFRLCLKKTYYRYLTDHVLILFSIIVLVYKRVVNKVTVISALVAFQPP